jgi:cytoskeletal protein RodZ
MATSSERELLKPPAPGDEAKDHGDRRRLADELQRLVKAKLATLFVDAGVAVPRDLSNDKAWTVGSIESRLSELKKVSGIAAPPDVSEVIFAAFRAAKSKRKAGSSARTLSGANITVKRAAVEPAVPAAGASVPPQAAAAPQPAPGEG